MKSPLGKFRGFKLHKSDSKDKRDFLHPAHLDELAQAAEDMQDMRNCYDSLLSAAAATANSAYEFSESLREMGTCLLEKTALHDDEESGKILLMLGKAQFELQKFVDNYRSHIFLTITNPSESLLNELRTVEDMKRQCDEKRNVYEYMAAQQKEKGRSKSGKGESFTMQQLRSAHEEYNEEATLCIFRLKSLKQGQSRSLLTQAARHHAAQLNFFRKGLKSLEVVDPQVKLVTEQHHIDYQFNGLEDDSREDGEDDAEAINDTTEGGELSFDYRLDNKKRYDTLPSRSSMEVSSLSMSCFGISLCILLQLNPDRNHGDLPISSREPKSGSHSAPIFPERKFDPGERIRQMQHSPRKSNNAYVLPTPGDAKFAVSSRTSTSTSQTKSTTDYGMRAPLWHSSPLDQKRPEKDPGESNGSSNPSTTQLLPPRLSEGISYDNNKGVRQAFSGPIIGKSMPTTKQGVVTSPRVSPTASPPLSSPKINELHELPRPPGILAGKPVKPTASSGHSAPLVRNNEPYVVHRHSGGGTTLASPLPIPPLSVSRSFSIPSSSQRAMSIKNKGGGEADSPPLTPLSLANLKLAAAVPDVFPRAGQIRGM
ncbi:unnamed protein product [Linum tenue]|uniref:BAR domain-containing protein n=1 Tax=Linum tenue TaxID=586396 RepID=A0AAV0IH64_9ROSI|nr:unnamed protein product [Linum tenue]